MIIAASSKVTIVDTASNKGSQCTVGSLFRKYADKMISNSITFNDGIWIKDWTGYTKLKSITKYDDPPLTTWYMLAGTSLGSKRLIVTGDEYIVTYDPDQSKIGFHGEVLYKYTLNKAAELHNGFYMREFSKRPNHTDGHPNIFTKMEITSFTPNENYRCGVRIETQSGHYLVNGYDMNGLPDPLPPNWYNEDHFK